MILTLSPLFIEQPVATRRIAYAYINSWLSVYNDEWCRSVSGQLHEVGHNLNLDHSQEGNDEYGDQSGMMVRTGTLITFISQCFHCLFLNASFSSLLS